MANHAGGFAYLEYDYMDQTKNWSGTKQAPAANNSDKEIRTSFYTAGIQYMFNRKWGGMIEAPYWNRDFRTTDDSGDIVDFTHGAIGDIRLKAVYSGFSPDMSTGLTFGAKLPTGDSTYPNFDPDTEIGTGSTDLLLGGYHTGQLDANGAFLWFTNGQLDQPILHAYSYKPGAELDGAIGLYYNSWTSGNAKIAPLVQVLGSQRWRDSLSAADSADSGYARLILSPGVEIHAANYRIYADVEFPVWQNYNGSGGGQLTAADAIKVNVGREF